MTELAKTEEHFLMLEWETSFLDFRTVEIQQKHGNCPRIRKQNSLRVLFFEN
jgi:hypothetical protein